MGITDPLLNIERTLCAPPTLKNKRGKNPITFSGQTPHHCKTAAMKKHPYGPSTQTPLEAQIAAWCTQPGCAGASVRYVCQHCPLEMKETRKQRIFSDKGWWPAFSSEESKWDHHGFVFSEFFLEKQTQLLSYPNSMQWCVEENLSPPYSTWAYHRSQ